MSRVTQSLIGFVDSVVGFLVMILLAIVSFYFTVFVVATGGSLAGQAPNGNFVVLSAALLVVAAILAGGLSPVSALGGMGPCDTRTSASGPTRSGEDDGGSVTASTEPAGERAADFAEPPSNEPTATEPSLARFQVYRDNAEEWRWRLVHRNGNVIATSGEGYASDRAARRGMRSVLRNAPGAEVQWEE